MSLVREVSDFLRLMGDSEGGRVQIAFYSERDVYFKYYEGFIEALLAESSIDIHYITSDPGDPIFQRGEPRLKTFFIHRSFPVALSMLKARVVVMTMPDLNLMHVKKGRNVAHHVYAFHAIASAHLQYRRHAFDHYDVVLCGGPHHVDELRRLEALNASPAKQLVECGYPLLEKIHREHVPGPPPRKILVAPTWGPDSIPERCMPQLIDVLERVGRETVIRLHPEFIKRKPSEVAKIRSRAEKTSNIRLDLDMMRSVDLHDSVLLTDSSGIALEYALGTERPVLYLDIPVRIDNEAYDEMGVEAMELALRPIIGRVVKLDELDRIGDIVDAFGADSQRWREEITRARERYLFNWGTSAESGARALLNLCSEDARTKIPR